MSSSSSSSRTPSSPKPEPLGTGTGRRITISTSDNPKQKFTVEEEVAMQSKTIETYFEDAEARYDTTMPLYNVSSTALRRIVNYCENHLRFRNDSAVKAVIKQFDEDYVRDLSIDALKELILAANYLEVKGLLELLTITMADRIKNKSVEFVRKLFEIEHDYTPEEEANLRQEYAWAFDGVDRD